MNDPPLDVCLPSGGWPTVLATQWNICVFGPDGLLGPARHALPPHRLDLIRTARGVKQDLRPRHRRECDKLRVPPVPADDQRAQDAVDLEQRQFVAAPAVFCSSRPAMCTLAYWWTISPCGLITCARFR